MPLLLYKEVTLMSNILFVIVGPSGSGKTSVMRSIMTNELRSLTTRSKRQGETEKDYDFTTRDKYSYMLKYGKLLEHTEYDGNFYGLSKEEVDTKLAKAHAFVVVDREGMRQLNDYYDNCINILLYSTKRECMINMLDRGDDIDKVNSRLSTYEEETSNTEIFDYVVRNIRHNKEFTEGIVHEIVRSEKVRNRRGQL